MNQFFLSCPKGLENLLEEELKSLNISNTKISYGGVSFESEFKDAIHVMLNSRLASRVFLKIVSWTVKSEQDLYDQAKKFKWDNFFTIRESFKIKSIIARNDFTPKGGFKNTMFISQKLKDGMADWFRDHYKGERPSVDKDNALVSFLLFISGDKADVLVDLAGHPLSNRGYREQGFIAPMKENLAAALLTSMEWNKTDDVFIDLMSGSGTVLIEALMMKGKIPPTFINVKKDYYYHLENFVWFKKDADLKKIFYNEKMLVLKKYELGVNELKRFPRIIGIDVNKAHLNICENHLRSCGFLDFVDLQKQDATRMNPPFEKLGVVFCNPPYGERLEAPTDELNDLYYQLGENLKKNFKGYKAYLLCGNMPLIKKISLRTSQKLPFFNGDIECRLVRYNLY